MPRKTIESPASLDPIHDLIYRNSKALVLKLALEMDLFTAFDDEPRTSEELSTVLQCEEKGIQATADALTAMGFLTKHDSKYQLAPTTAAFLVKGSPSYYGDSYLDAVLPWAWQTDDIAANAIRGGDGIGKSIIDDDSVAMWKGWCETRYISRETHAADARENWGLILEQHTVPEGAHLVDVACGNAFFTFTYLQNHPHASTVAIDRAPEVLEVTRKTSRWFDVFDRTQFVAADVRNVPTKPHAFDLAYIGGIMYILSAEEIDSTLKNVHRALKPGGLIVLETMIADGEHQESEAELIQTFRRLLYNGGRVPTFDEYADHLTTVGFADAKRLSHTIVVAHRK